MGYSDRKMEEKKAQRKAEKKERGTIEYKMKHNIRGLGWRESIYSAMGFICIAYMFFAADMVSYHSFGLLCAVSIPFVRFCYRFTRNIVAIGARPGGLGGVPKTE